MDREDHEMFIREEMPNKVLNYELHQFYLVDTEIYLFVSSLKISFYGIWENGLCKSHPLQ